MIQGIRLPISGSGSGGLVLVTDDDYLRQLVMTALADCSSENPFQSIGLGEGHIFKERHSRTKGSILVLVQKIFEDFERRNLARFKEAVWQAPDADGELWLLVKYWNLETDSEEQMLVK